MEYRKKIDLPTGSDYWFVHMGPIPNKPEWHQMLYANNIYAFPTEFAANRFADNHRAEYPGRSIKVRRGQ